MAAASPHGEASMLRERRRAKGGHRFQPENYYEINRVLGQRFMPAEINRVVSKHRADAASAYLKRLHRDVNRAQKGFYQNMSVFPLQIKSLSVKKEDGRNFKSLLIPKLAPLTDSNPSPRSLAHAPSPKEVRPAIVVPPDGSSYVPHKFFSPHTHIHVLYKQNPGAVSRRRGCAMSSVGSGGNSPTGVGHKSPRNVKLPNKKLSPRRDEGAASKVPEDKDPEWPQEHVALPYTYPKFAAKHAPLPHIKKRVSADKGSVRFDPSRTSVTMPGAPRGWADNSSTQQSGRQLGGVDFGPATGRNSGMGTEDGLPPSVAAALAAGNASDRFEALYRLNFPPELAASYEKNLPSERATAVAAGNYRGRLPPPSNPTSIKTNELLANAVHAAA